MNIRFPTIHRLLPQLRGKECMVITLPAPHTEEKRRSDRMAQRQRAGDSGTSDHGARRSLAAMLLAGVLFMTLSVAPVRALTFAVTVTTTADSNNGCANTGTGTCSLRDAILYANYVYGVFVAPTTITLPTNISPYVLTQIGELDIKANITINGGGASATVIDGNNTDRVFQVFAGYTLIINNITIQHGRPQGTFRGGGGILSSGTLNLTNVTCHQ